MRIGETIKTTIMTMVAMLASVGFEACDKTWTADLLFYPENNFGIENYCQVSPTLKDKEDKDEYVVFNATSPYNMWFYPENSNWTFNKFSGFKYGFELSTTKNFSQTKDLNGLQIDDNTIITNYTVSFSHSLPSKELEPETQYYYRAYLNDGTNIYYSDPKEFTTPARISQVIPEDIRKKMEPYIPIYDGASPPNIEGVYLMDSPRIVYDATGTIDSDYDGFAPMYFKISNQDMTNNTLDFQERQIGPSLPIKFSHVHLGESNQNQCNSSEGFPHKGHGR
jgi:hypothetical protein